MDPQTNGTPDPNSNGPSTPLPSQNPSHVPDWYQNVTPTPPAPGAPQPSPGGPLPGPTVFGPAQNAPLVPPSTPDGSLPPAGTIPAAGPNPPFAPPPQPVVGTPSLPPPTPAGYAGTPDLTALPPLKTGKSRKKLALIVVSAVIVLGLGGASAYYFGYYKNPARVYSQSLSNGNKLYAKLMDYVTSQSKANYKGVVGSGSYKFVSGSTTTDGTLSFQSNSTDSDTTVSVGLGVTRINVDLRTIKPAGQSNPDIYLKASGISGLGTLLGSPELDQEINPLDGQWIVIDHTLLDNLQKQVTSSQSLSAATLTEADVISEMQAFGNVNQQYVFTGNTSKSVFTKLNTYGLETIDGHKVYHYKVGFNKANLKQYITAQRDALKSSALGTWLAKNGESTAIDNAYNSLETSANSVNSKDTFDLWSDINSRVIYKVRISDPTNPAANFVDIGLNYNGGDTIPLFVNLQDNEDSDDTTGSLTATVNTDTNAIAFNMSLRDKSSSSTTLTASATFKPSTTAINIATPQNPMQLSQLLDQLGLGDLLNTYLQPAGSTPADTSTTDPISISL